MHFLDLLQKKASLFQKLIIILQRKNFHIMNNSQNEAFNRLNINIEQISTSIYNGISSIINDARQKIVVYVNSQANMMFWQIGKYIVDELKYETYSAYGDKILATVSQRLTEQYGKGYSYSALTRMMKVATIYNNEEMFATVSQTLSWGHFLELITIKNSTERLFYQQLSIAEHWSIRDLREKQKAMSYERSLIVSKSEKEITTTLKNTTPEHIEPSVVFKNSYIVDFLGLSGDYTESDLEDAIVKQLEKFILELGQGFAFLERQKRFTIDKIDYYLDLLFYHRRLNCLVAIDLKHDKFRPEYKGQMEFYLKYMQKHDMKSGENPPIGLLLCSEGNTEHIELLMLDDDNIKVAQYLTYLPDKQWFIDKLNRSILIAKENVKK